MHLLGTHQYRSTLQPPKPAKPYRSHTTRNTNRCLAFLIE